MFSMAYVILVVLRNLSKGMIINESHADIMGI